MNSRSFFLVHAQDIIGIIAILLFSRSCFRPEVCLSIVNDYLLRRSVNFQYILHSI